MMRFGALVGAWLLIALPAAAETATRGIVEIEAGDGVEIFQVEIADEPGEHSRGLMYRKALAENSGMLFLYPQPRQTAFWMKNTLIPLDMLFIDRQGRIVKIARETEPYSLKPISSDAIVTAVLEIDGGMAEQLGIKIGARARWVEFPEAE